jgi:THAP4-like, heme-binding beta-barrel domain
MQNVRITSGIDYGNLTGLIGTWQGANGFNMIAVPDQNGEFTLLVAPYTETLTVNALPATTPNRGLQTIANLPTLQYATTIIDLEDNILMHAENGFWELLNDTAGNMGFDIFRIASVPHGDAVQAMGISSVYDGPPVIDQTLSGLPVGDLPAIGGKTSAGYTDPYLFPVKYPDFFPTNPNKTLADYLAVQEKSGLTVTKTVELKVSTQNNGGINSIASLVTNANPTQFDATFWLETLTDSAGTITQQLQYSQRIMLAFPIKTNYSGQTIVWPHINVNTLTLTT